MLHYIINTTIIWLACLLLYEWLLKKESFHQYNRIYLLLSLAAGLLLPAVQLKTIMPANDSVLYKPSAEVYQLAEHVQDIKEPIAINMMLTAPIPNAETYPSTTDLETAFWWVYLTGVLLGAAFILREALQLVRLYAKGTRATEKGCCIVQTGKSHAPFSFFNIVFVGSKETYNSNEWNLLQAHEAEHGRQLHSLDNIMLLVLRVLFWFHPLPHIYYKRLMMVNEFQADEAASKNTQRYGAFLLEQSLLQSAPILTHSLNYSPIKNRIAMLTKTKSARARLVKYTAIIPLSFVLILVGTQTTLSEIRSNNVTTIYYKGAEIKMQIHKILPFRFEREVQVLKQQSMFTQYQILPDSIAFKDDWKGGIISFMRVPIDTTAVAINGKPIYGNEAMNAFLPADMANADGKYVQPVYAGPIGSLEQYLFSELQPDLNKLQDGYYTLHLNKVVVDDKGTIAYYHFKGISGIPANGILPQMNNAVKKAIDEKVVEVLDEPIKFRPAMKDGKPVNVRLNVEFQEIEVKGHVARLIARTGC